MELLPVLAAANGGSRQDLHAGARELFVGKREDFTARKMNGTEDFRGIELCGILSGCTGPLTKEQLIQRVKDKCINIFLCKCTYVLGLGWS